MTRQEIEKRIEELEDRRFWINMGHIDWETRHILWGIDAEISKLRTELQNI